MATDHDVIVGAGGECDSTDVAKKGLLHETGISKSRMAAWGRKSVFGEQHLLTYRKGDFSIMSDKRSELMKSVRPTFLVVSPQHMGKERVLNAFSVQFLPAKLTLYSPPRSPSPACGSCLPKTPPRTHKTVIHRRRLFSLADMLVGKVAYA
ncbi:hypothetical protein Bbelb_285550 [Branchiostoma belcheri]|nr:hypothetical protein Bbelb_285550 [Branchiostoma belcheri]